MKIVTSHMRLFQDICKNIKECISNLQYFIYILHWTNSLHSLLASDWVIHFGIHLTTRSPLSSQPKSFGDGRICRVSRHLLHIPDWYRQRLKCKNKEFLQGGIVSAYLRNKSKFLLYLHHVYWKFVNTSNTQTFQFLCIFLQILFLCLDML